MRRETVVAERLRAGPPCWTWVRVIRCPGRRTCWTSTECRVPSSALMPWSRLCWVPTTDLEQALWRLGLSVAHLAAGAPGADHLEQSSR